MSIYQLLMSCPDDQVARMRAVYRCALENDWESAQAFLINAASEGITPWHADCKVMAEVVSKFVK